jgi:hypothetical protein
MPDSEKLNAVVGRYAVGDDVRGKRGDDKFASSFFNAGLAALRKMSQRLRSVIEDAADPVGALKTTSTLYKGRNLLKVVQG